VYNLSVDCLAAKDALLMAYSRNPDVIVIGAGVVGTSIAFHLAQAGAQVTLIDQGGVCAGMTSRSGALIRMHYTFAPEAELAWKSLDYFRNWKDRVGAGDPGFMRTGVALVVGPNNVDKLRANIAMLQAIGIDTRLCDPDDLVQLDSGINVDDVAAAAYEPLSGYANPVATTQGFASALLQQHNTGVLHNCVSRLICNGNIATGAMLADGDMLHAATVCLATGPWTDPLLTPYAPPIGLKIERAQIGFFRRRSTLRHMACIDTVTGAYFRPHGEDLTLAGLGAWRPEEDANPDNFDHGNDADFVAEVGRRLDHRILGMRDAPYAHGHAGLYDVSPDARAVLGKVPGIEGLYVAAGFSGTGFKTAPAVGAAMAELILFGQSRIVDITPFRFERLLEGAPIQSPNEYEMGADFGHKL
jgi:sarcosine oxidase subunit beta